MRMKKHKDFKDFDKKASATGFDKDMYENIKKKSKRAREEIDPEFEEELK